MELEFEREIIEGWETLAELTLCQEETQETIVPDACPDILRIIGVSGQSILSSKQAREASQSPKPRSGTRSGTRPSPTSSTATTPRPPSSCACGRKSTTPA